MDTFMMDLWHYKQAAYFYLKYAKHPATFVWALIQVPILF